MDVFTAYLQKIENKSYLERMTEILTWIKKTYPHLEAVIKWNQPMFTDHGTYIIGFSIAKNHIAIAPEQAGISQFTEDIEKAGYTHTKELFRIKWKQNIDYALLAKIIEFNIIDKADYSKFWR